MGSVFTRDVGKGDLDPRVIVVHKGNGGLAS